jgi:hypothetical protein
MADGQVVFEITADGKHAIASIKDVTKAIESETKKWDKAAGDSADDAESAWTGAVGKIAGALSAAGVASILMNWGKAAISAASDLAEVQNVVDVTFGEGAAKIESWSKTAGKQFGLTETQAKKFTSTLGAMMKSAGVSDNEIVQMSTDLAGLAADMASFYNLDFDTAFQKIRSGISGETEPLKQLGVNMSAANLEAFRLEQGITKAYSAMSQGEQTALRYQYIMKATADAQGDFARTSDGFANATRRVQTALETIKTVGGGVMMQVIEPITTGLASILEKVAQQPDTTALDEINRIGADAASQMADVEATYSKALAIVGLLDEISQTTIALGDGSTTTFEDLFKGIGELEKSGGNIQEYIAGLGLDVDEVILKYNEWKESTRQLTSLIPSLTSVIDEETGAIDGGTDALQKNLDEWKANEEKKVAWSAYYAKERALAEKKGQMFMYQFEADAARKAVERQRKELASLFEFDQNGNIIGNPFETGATIPPEMQAAIDKYTASLREMKRAEETLTEQTVDFSEAEQQLADGKQALIEKYGEEETAAKYAAQAVEDYGGKSTSAWKETTSTVNDAVKALADYVQGVHDATEQTVNSVVKGFDQITRPTADLVEKRSQLIEQQNALNRSTRDGEKQYQELQKQIDELNKSIDEYSPKGMQDALQSQLAFMDEYIQNLEKARSMGLSNELLASLSDGSVQSAEYLSELVNNPEQAATVDALFKQVQESKKQFTDALTEQKLTVDDTYNSMVEKAKESISQMNLGDEAADAMGETISGLAQGISSHVGEVSDAVDSIISELDRLSGYGINISLGGFGSMNFGNLLDGEHETGLDYVPFDGYLAGLHEGEGILTAEENRIWQRFKNGAQPQTMDYDALGTAMRDNVKAGGDVYLDGRVVGAVISKQQGNSYRALQRSGWQG